jgi:hypothetical protein
MSFTKAQLQTAQQKVANWLINYFDPQVGLIVESPQVHQNLRWLYIDNYSAMHALQNSGIPTATATVQAIQATFAKWKPPPHGRIEIVYDQPQPEPFLYPIHWIVKQYQGRVPGQSGLSGQDAQCSYFVETEVANNQQPIPSSYSLESDQNTALFGTPLTYGDYGDILCYAAMNRRLGVPAPKNMADLWGFENTSALELLEQANTLWNGVGINDRYRQEQKILTYCTYKLALLTIANLKFGLTPPNGHIENLLAMQDLDGGIVTDYNPDLMFAGSKNCETSAFFLQAMNLLLKAMS